MRTRSVLGPAGLAIGAALVIRLAGRDKSRKAESSRWYTVTVDIPVDEVTLDPLPAPLAELGDLVEVRAVAAPGHRGTEISARLRESGKPTGEDPRQAVRRALRNSKQLLEVGEIILQEPQPEGHRPSTPPGRLVDVLARRSSGEGVL